MAGQQKEIEDTYDKLGEGGWEGIGVEKRVGGEGRLGSTTYHRICECYGIECLGPIMSAEDTSVRGSVFSIEYE